MAELPTAFNAEEHGEMMDFSPIPSGFYIAKIIESDMQLTKKAKERRDPTVGQMLVLTTEVIVGPYKARKLWARLNLINETEKAVQIANDELATILRACGKNTVRDSGELHDIPMILKVGVTRGDANNPPQNTIHNYFDADNAKYLAQVDQTPKAGAAAGAAAPQAVENSAPKTKMWEE